MGVSTGPGNLGHFSALQQPLAPALLHKIKFFIKNSLNHRAAQLLHHILFKPFPRRLLLVPQGFCLLDPLQEEFSGYQLLLVSHPFGKRSLDRLNDLEIWDHTTLVSHPPRGFKFKLSSFTAIRIVKVLDSSFLAFHQRQLHTCPGHALTHWLTDKDKDMDNELVWNCSWVHDNHCDN